MIEAEKEWHLALADILDNHPAVSFGDTLVNLGTVRIACHIVCNASLGNDDDQLIGHFNAQMLQEIINHYVSGSRAGIRSAVMIGILELVISEVGLALNSDDPVDGSNRLH